MTKRPQFRTIRKQLAYDTPEELFGKLPNRAKSHGYLRGPQVDALRAYVDHKGATDIALELPTGTGKTTVGLTIAEWRRRSSGGAVAYLALTNQLAAQVLSEAACLGIDCADLRGSKETRKAAEVGRYRSAQAIGVTTYSNLFNVRPVIQKANLLVLDDAHGGEQVVAGMWTCSVGRTDHAQLYMDVLAAIRPGLSDSQYESISRVGRHATVEVADSVENNAIFSALQEVLDPIDVPSIKYPWLSIRDHLNACVVLASYDAIVVRPFTPPTHTHSPFIDSSQRIYLSATLSGPADLQRGYGIGKVRTIHAEHPQWGRRYIFAPGLHFEELECAQLVAGVWKAIEQRRMLLLAPSFPVAQAFTASLKSGLKPRPETLAADDIEDSLDPFTTSEDTILALAGRYDGIDLPGDSCRLMIVAESPAAIGSLERHQRDRWKLGPLLRRRERTRLVQGMGRCTRDATDFSVILLLGQSATDAITSDAVVSALPGAIQREIKWGIAQGEQADDDVESLIEMITGLLMDKSYRREANESIEDFELFRQVPDPKEYISGAEMEVQYSRSLWDGDYTRAYEVAREASDATTGNELAAYRAWWLFLASLAARLLGDADAEIDCLTRARATGINSGQLDYLIRRRTGSRHLPATTPDLSQIDAIWTHICDLGWHGPKFAQEASSTTAELNETDTTTYHMGLEALGIFLGAETMRPTERGAPDVIWIIGNVVFLFEAKSAKDSTSSLSKRDVLQAKGHPEWLASRRSDLSKAELYPIIVSPTLQLDDSAQPHAKGVFGVQPDVILDIAQRTTDELGKLRAKHAGKEFRTSAEAFAARLSKAALLTPSLKKDLLVPLL